MINSSYTSYLGAWDGQCELTFGLDGKPMYISGPYDNGAANIRKLNRKLGDKNYDFARSQAEFERVYSFAAGTDRKINYLSWARGSVGVARSVEDPDRLPCEGITQIGHRSPAAEVSELLRCVGTHRCVAVPQSATRFFNQILPQEPAAGYTEVADPTPTCRRRPCRSLRVPLTQTPCAAWRRNVHRRRRP